MSRLREQVFSCILTSKDMHFWDIVKQKETKLWVSSNDFDGIDTQGVIGGKRYYGSLLTCVLQNKRKNVTGQVSHVILGYELSLISQEGLQFSQSKIYPLRYCSCQSSLASYWLVAMAFSLHVLKNQNLQHFHCSNITACGAKEVWMWSCNAWRCVSAHCALIMHLTD